MVKICNVILLTGILKRESNEELDNEITEKDV